MFHDPARDPHRRDRDEWREDRYDELRYDERRAHERGPWDRDGEPDARRHDHEDFHARPEGPVGGPAWGQDYARRDERRDDRGDDRREAAYEEERRRREFDFGRTDRRYSLDDTRRRLPREETERLIASDKVEGSPVFDLHGRRVGEVANFMVDKRSGRVEYAVVRVRGGLLHGEAWRPVEWRDLTFDDRLDGYQIDMERAELRDARDFERRR
ncbi:PRC-barrel domain-containing protein [Brevundimonas sp. 2R-24]|uniref:PRC-barrel domain-containing protein n=1 Tax=Peiella sedimenti TaxID=3061083 RepID=A0ABT8SM54_9CAUL|nr:PRC-barrel domain-containing protein [Caulobacteraceae bacterium XZ-24]